MVCDNHGRNYQLGDPPCWPLVRDSGEDAGTKRKRLGVKRPQHPILSTGW